MRDDENKIYYRDEHLGNQFTVRHLDQFLEGEIEKIQLSFEGRPINELTELIRSTKKWRYRHGIDDLDLYTAYDERIDAMKLAIDNWLGKNEFRDRISSLKVIDLACSEGFFANHFKNIHGVQHIDCCELSEEQHKRMRLVEAFYSIKESPLYKVDFDTVDWSSRLKAITGQSTWDIVLCLGIAYHLENPVLFLRHIANITKEICILESDTPHTQGSDGFRGFGTFHLNRDQVTLSTAGSNGKTDIRYLFELRPSLNALINCLLGVGFQSVEILPSSDHTGSRFYKRGEKTMLVCRK